jgi:hypothetical protein
MAVARQRSTCLAGFSGGVTSRAGYPAVFAVVATLMPFSYKEGEGVTAKNESVLPDVGQYFKGE